MTRPTTPERPSDDEEHGYLLLPRHMNYNDLRTPGKILIHRDRHQVLIEIADFECGESSSCRQHVTKAMCWARDVLNAAIENNRLVPGGGIVSVEWSGVDLGEKL